ncbi:hypothetical protein BJX62DRAFT_119843 [Aspergillus germanicus]
MHGLSQRGNSQIHYQREATGTARLFRGRAHFEPSWCGIHQSTRVLEKHHGNLSLQVVQWHSTYLLIANAPIGHSSLIARLAMRTVTLIESTCVPSGPTAPDGSEVGQVSSLGCAVEIGRGGKAFTVAILIDDAWRSVERASGDDVPTAPLPSLHICIFTEGRSVPCLGRAATAYGVSPRGLDGSK